MSENTTLAQAEQNPQTGTEPQVAVRTESSVATLDERAYHELVQGLKESAEPTPAPEAPKEEAKSEEAPVADETPIQAEEVQIDEAKINGIDQLKKIRDSKQHGTVNHLDGSASKVDGFTASAILQVHDKLNDENKKKIANMVSNSHYHLSKVANFAFSKSK